MKITMDKIIEVVDGRNLTESINPQNVEISGGYVSDLLSDVMGGGEENDVWITIMRHLNVIAVASLKGIPAIIFPKNIVPEKPVITKANDEGICLISCPLTTFQTSGKIFEFLNK